MELMTKHLLPDEHERSDGWIVPAAIDMRLGYLFSLSATWVGFGIFGFDPFGSAEWQDGQLGTYFDLSFSETVWVFFAPFLIYSSLSMLLLLWDASKFSSFWWVRLGVYTGLILAVQFSIQVALSTELVIGFIFGVVAILPTIIGYYALKLGVQYVWQHRDNKQVLIVTAVVTTVLIVGLVFGGGVVLIGVLCAAVLACPLIAVLTAIRLFMTIDKHNGKQLPLKIMSFVGWGTLWGGAGYVAINQVFDLYTQLPTEPPNCYVATASAKGHARLVGSRPVTLANGSVLLVSRQLQILKAGELVLRQLVPNVHRFIRLVYNRIGPKLAVCIRSKWSADVGYFCFKPLEWITLLLIYLFLPAQLSKIRHFYMGKGR